MAQIHVTQGTWQETRGRGFNLFIEDFCHKFPSSRSSLDLAQTSVFRGVKTRLFRPNRIVVFFGEPLVSRVRLTLDRHVGT